MLLFLAAKALNKQSDIMKKGVYTAICGGCEQPNYMHVDDKGSFDPLRCRSCKADFLGIEEGDKANKYVASVPSEEKSDLEEKSEEKPAKKSKSGSVKLEVQEIQ